MTKSALESITAEAAPPPEPKGRLYMDARLTPNRSLTRPAFMAMAAAAGGLGVVAATFYVSLGAWPIAGFFGGEFLLLLIAFWVSYRQGRLSETVRVSAERLHVARRQPSGKVQHFTLAPYWARVDIDDPVRHDSQVRVSSHGRTLVLGAFLAPEERADFARSLRAALAAARGPEATLADGAELGAPE